MKNKYSKLPLPEKSAWKKKSWRSFVHWRLRYFLDGVYNIIRWIPTIYKDKDWDDYYITKLLQKKIEHQRKYLVEANRHVNILTDNYWMTVVLNLIEREHEDHYGTEYTDYVEFGEGIFDDPISEHLIDYLHKYPNDVRRVMKKYEGIDFTDHYKLAMYVSMYRQYRCRNLIFEILKRKSNQWWD